MVATLTRPDLSVLLKDLLARHNLVVEDLAQMTGIPEGTIKNWTSGRTKTFDVNVIGSIAKALGYDVGVLATYFYTGEMAKPLDPALAMFVRGVQAVRSDRRTLILRDIPCINAALPGRCPSIVTLGRPIRC